MNTNCYCGTGKNFADCCQLFIQKTQDPDTAEQLMRSRFSAYAIQNGQYIYDTYATTSQASHTVEEIEQWSKACVWIALEVHINENGMLKEESSQEQFVEFSAYYVHESTLCELREKSRFILEEVIDSNHQSKQWRYIDGEIKLNQALSTIKRKETCPCNLFPTAWSINKAKKFKQCCGKEA